VYNSRRPEAEAMPTSHGRHCRRCRVRIPRKIRLCRICGALNFKFIDYVIFALLLAAGLYAAWRWL
jgi:hypothetical protein